MPASEEVVFKDALFRKKGKRGTYTLVPPPTPPLEGLVADTHAHLDMLPDAALALARSAMHGIGFVCTIADPTEDHATTYNELASWQQEAKALLKTFVAQAEKEEAACQDARCAPSIPRVRIGIGCHPHNAKNFTPDVEKALLARLKDKRTCAIGEVGLDYHYDYSPRETQRSVFRRQIQIAHETELPLILHLREAHNDGLAIMDEEGFPKSGVLLHCFNLDFDALEPWLTRGVYVAFGGPLTFKKSDDTREAAAHVSQKRLLTETDAPFMTPEPLRGMTCGPEHTIFTAEKLAEIHAAFPGEERKAFLAQVYQNALDLLDRPPTPWQLSYTDSEGK